MKRIVKYIANSIVFFITVSLPAFPNISEITYYYSFNTLSHASAPKELQVIQVTSPDTHATKLLRGILFSYKNRKTGNVWIAGNFSSWKKIPMKKGMHGVWYYFLSKKQQQNTIQYKFCVNGIWIVDPNNPQREDDNNGSFISVIEPESNNTKQYMSYHILNENTVEFRYYAPKAHYVAIVGDFNNWNPENDLLRKGNDHIWRLKKILPRGKYRYKYVIDGKWVTDIYNEQSASDEVGGIASILTIQ